MLAWWAHPNGTTVDSFMRSLGLEDEVEEAAPEISDEEIERLFDSGRMGFFPPGMKG